MHACMPGTPESRAAPRAGVRGRRRCESLLAPARDRPLDWIDPGSWIRDLPAPAPQASTVSGPGEPGPRPQPMLACMLLSRVPGIACCPFHACMHARVAGARVDEHGNAVPDARSSEAEGRTTVARSTVRMLGTGRRTASAALARWACTHWARRSPALEPILSRCFVFRHPTTISSARASTIHHRPPSIRAAHVR